MNNTKKILFFLIKITFNGLYTNVQENNNKKYKKNRGFQRKKTKNNVNRKYKWGVLFVHK